MAARCQPVSVFLQFWLVKFANSAYSDVMDQFCSDLEKGPAHSRHGTLQEKSYCHHEAFNLVLPGKLPPAHSVQPAVSRPPASLAYFAATQALTTRPTAAKALNMVSIDIREPNRFPLPAIAAALLASPNLTHLAVALPHPRRSIHYIDSTPLLYACGPSLRELTLTSHVPMAALTEFLMTHPNLVSLSLPYQSTESVVELPAECVPRLASITAPPALVACLVPNRPVTHVVVSRAVPRECMSAVVESLVASLGPVTSLGMETEEVTLGVMQELTFRLRELRSLWVKGRFSFKYSLSYSVSSQV